MTDPAHTRETLRPRLGEARVGIAGLRGLGSNVAWMLGRMKADALAENCCVSRRTWSLRRTRSASTPSNRRAEEKALMMVLGFTSSVSDEHPLVASRVTLAAAHQALLVVRILLGCPEP